MTRGPLLRSMFVASLAAGGLAVPLLLAPTASGAGAAAVVAPPAATGPVGHELPKVPVMRGSGGAVASVDPVASQVGIDVLEQGGNAADAAVATAAALGVTEPYSAGIGGGGFFVHYDAATRQVKAIDGREAAPATFTERTFLNPDGTPMNFSAAVSSGLSVGVPGTPATWAMALRAFGTMSLADTLKPAQAIAQRGFVVDATFNQQTVDNAARFAMFPETARVYLPGGQPPAVGSVFRNPDLAKAYAELRTNGVASLYHGALGRAVVAEARAPHTAPGFSVLPGQLTRADLAAYRAVARQPVHSRYRDLDVYGMPVPSSGGIAVAEILNLMAAYEARTGVATDDLTQADYLHRFSEAAATAFADRNRYVGDVAGVPVAELTSKAFAAERACLFDPDRAQVRPVPFGSPDGSYTSCAAGSTRQAQPREGQSTTHLTTADRWGNVVAYTLTIEQTGGSGITVPGYGFLLNNELTDFSFAPVTAGVPDPNLPGPGKRPRSSMSPTILLSNGRPYLALGSPGGASIITSVSQTILEYLNRDRSLVGAVAAPRLSSRNGTEQAEARIYDTVVGDRLRDKGHVLAPIAELGAVTAIRTPRPDWFVAAAETTRRGGGSAMVVQIRR